MNKIKLFLKQYFCQHLSRRTKTYYKENPIAIVSETHCTNCGKAVTPMNEYYFSYYDRELLLQLQKNEMEKKLNENNTDNKTTLL